MNQVQPNYNLAFVAPLQAQPSTPNASDIGVKSIDVIGFAMNRVIPAKPRAAVGIRLAVRGSGRVPTVAERQGARGR
jgi:hypothetical protein